MLRKADVIVRRARALVGTRFRAQGRGGDGLDCIGLVAAAVGASRVPADYALRGGSLRRLEIELRRAGLEPEAEAEAGDVLAMASGPAQLHLAVHTGTGFVHADAGLRRVVERPGKPPWPIIGIWRSKDG
jgi:cell wall-associated NlpC family hydrolase